MNYNYIGIFEFEEEYYEVVSIKEDHRLLLEAGRFTNNTFLSNYEIEYQPDDPIDEVLMKLYDIIQEVQ